MNRLTDNPGSPKTDEEYVDIIDSDGRQIGTAISRRQVHKTGDLHRTVHVWIINSSSEILLQKRSANKESYPCLWDISSAGHIKSGQSSIDAAISETREELSISLSSSEFRFIFNIKSRININNGTFIDNELNDVFLVMRDIPASAFVLQKDEVSDIMWIHYKKLREKLLIEPEKFVPHEEEYEKLFEIIDKQNTLGLHDQP
jgi:isopentenyldiphosphate isomerase